MEPPPQPPAPSPFTPREPAAGGGRGRPLMIGCGVLTFLVGIAAIVFLIKAKDLLAWAMDRVREPIVAALPADVTAEERARLERGFAAAMAKIRAGEVEVPALKALQTQLTAAAEKAPRHQLTREDVLDLLSALERVGGLLPAADAEPAAPPGEPVPAPSP